MMAIFFFLMLFTLGIGSAVGLLNNIMTNMKDYFPRLKSWQLSLIGVLGCFSIGLMYVTNGGFHIIAIVDKFGGEFLVYALATIELIGVVWIYGLENVCWDVEFMLKRKVSAFWRISWGVVMPIVLIIIGYQFAVICYVDSTQMTYGENKESYPLLVMVLGWSLFVIGFGQIFLSVFNDFLTKRKQNQSVSKIGKYLFSINPEWGPKSNTVRTEWAQFKLSKLKERQQISIMHDHSWIQQKCWLLLGKYP